MPDYLANAVLFVPWPLGFGCRRRWPCGSRAARSDPTAATRPPRPRHRRAGWSRRSATSGARRAAGLGLLTIGAHRIVYGVVTVATILVYRNYFHTARPTSSPAIADLGPAGRGDRGRLRRRGRRHAAAVSAALGRPALWSSACLVASAVFQLLPGAIYSQVPLLVAAFLLGLTAQIIKICVDTLVQAHVDDEVKGRVFVLYDMVFNVALVLAAVIGAADPAADGARCRSSSGWRSPTCCSASGSRWSAATSRMDEGTESLRGETAEPVSAPETCPHPTRPESLRGPPHLPASPTPTPHQLHRLRTTCTWCEVDAAGAKWGTGCRGRGL